MAGLDVMMSQIGGVRLKVLLMQTGYGVGSSKMILLSTVAA